jgi:hypothetical protein
MEAHNFLKQASTRLEFYLAPSSDSTQVQHVNTAETSAFQTVLAWFIKRHIK